MEHCYWSNWKQWKIFILCPVSFLVYFIYNAYVECQEYKKYDHCVNVIREHYTLARSLTLYSRSWGSFNEELFISMRRQTYGKWSPSLMAWTERQREAERAMGRTPVGAVAFLGPSSCRQPVLTKKGLLNSPLSATWPHSPLFSSCHIKARRLVAFYSKESKQSSILEKGSFCRVNLQQQGEA